MNQIDKLMELADEFARRSADQEMMDHHGSLGDAEAHEARETLRDALEAALPKEPSRSPTPDVQVKIDTNTWDHLSDVLPTLKAMSRGDWYWGANFRCKYIELRIDTRDGGCLIRDAERVRISPEQLAHQSRPCAGMPPWPNGTAAPGAALNPKDWRLVPVDATNDMCSRANAMVDLEPALTYEEFRSIWKAMLAAAPTPPEAA